MKDLSFPIIKGPRPASRRLSIEDYHRWIASRIRDETPEQRERRLNRPMPVGERFEIKD